MTDRVSAAARYIYQQYKLGTYRLALAPDQISVIEQLIAERFMAGLFWLRLDGSSVCIEVIKPYVKPVQVKQTAPQPKQAISIINTINRTL